MLQQTSYYRQLETLATKFLLASGCSPDGRPVEEFDPKQIRFETRIAWGGRGDIIDLLPDREIVQS